MKKERRRQGRVWRDFWRLTKPYWSSEERFRAMGLFATCVGMSVANIFLIVQVSNYNRDFMNALTNFDTKTVVRIVGAFLVLALISASCTTFNSYLLQLLQVSWRRWMTHHLLARWLSGRSYYHVQVANTGQDNPDQRIAQDVREFVDVSLSTVFDALQSIMTLISFSVILWKLSGSIQLPIGAGKSIAIPGYLCWCALAYAFGGSFVIHKIGQKLSPLFYEQEKCEANFRFNLVRIREHAESIALSRGEDAETLTLRRTFGTLYLNFRSIMSKQKQINGFRSFFFQFGQFVPLILAAPRYLSKSITLGEYDQTLGAFGRVESALSFFIGSYMTLAKWRAIVDRLTGFIDDIDRSASLAEKASKVSTETQGQHHLVLEAVSLHLPNGKALLQNLQFEFPRGKSVLVTGASGCGKSTLFRTIAGIWPYSSGRALLPSGKTSMLLPQKPYLPIGTLREALIYPKASISCTQEDGLLIELMEVCRLSEFADQLDRVASWTLILSPGEQQRVAFVRAFYHRPDWLFLDEATSALDETTEAAVYLSIKELLPETSVVSIAHRSSVRQFHDLTFEVGARKKSAVATTVLT